MDVTQQYSIDYKGLKSGSHTFEFDIDGGLFQAFESQDIKDGKCHAVVQVDKAETQLDLNVSIQGQVIVECDRCLEDCPIDIDFNGDLLVRISNEEGEYDGEVMWVMPSEDEVNLAQYLYESIVLSLPYQRVHPEGQCNPDMLRRFQLVSEDEFSSIEQQAEHHENRSMNEAQFAKLEALRQQMVDKESK